MKMEILYNMLPFALRHVRMLIVLNICVTATPKRTATGMFDTDKEVSRPRSSRLSQRDLSSRDTTDSLLNTARPTRRNYMDPNWLINRHRRPTTPFKSTWDERDTEDKEEKESNFTMIIIASVAIAVALGLVCYVRCKIWQSHHMASSEPQQGTSAIEDSHLVAEVAESHDGIGAESAMGYAARSPDDTHTFTSEKENMASGSHPKPSAPPAESSENSSSEDPPPSYSSLFSSSAKVLNVNETGV